MRVLPALTRCAWRGHTYADNAPALSRWKPDAQPTAAWCTACEKRLPPRRGER